MGDGSKITDAEWKYAKPVPGFGPDEKTGALPPRGRYVDVGDGHRAYVQEFGRPDGEPVLFIHGGPGAACSTDLTRFFDPNRYRIIMYDQRGCGHSTPQVSKDTQAALTNNTTSQLINDINLIRESLGVRGKMHIFGGSWGSTLALAYAIEHPEKVQSLTLRGIFFASRDGLNYQYQGNAAEYDDSQPFSMEHFRAQPMTQTGTYRAYAGPQGAEGVIPMQYQTPEMAEVYAKSWDTFVRVIPKKDRGDMVKAYSEIFNMKEPMSAEQRGHQEKAAKAWAVWEDMTSYLVKDLSPEAQKTNKFNDANYNKTFAMIENHYFMNGCFMGGGSGEGHRDNNWIMENLDKIKNIPTYIVHGIFDQVSPVRDAFRLIAGMEKAREGVPEDQKAPLKLLTPVAGHSMTERENARLLTKFMDDMPPMTRFERRGGAPSHNGWSADSRTVSERQAALPPSR